MKLTFSLLLACFAAGSVFADPSERQSKSNYADDYWIDWQEDEVTSVPDFNLKKAIPVELNKTSQVKWFVDPDTMSIGKDNVFRYVVIAQGPTGTINAFYEGILCKEVQFKTYAKLITNEMPPPFNWRMVENPEWKSLSGLSTHNHEKALAKEFICDGASRPTSVSNVKKRMKNFNYDLSSQ